MSLWTTTKDPGYLRAKSALRRNEELSAGQVALLFGVESSTALRWARAGKMRAYKIASSGGAEAWRFPPLEVAHALAGISGEAE